MAGTPALVSSHLFLLLTSNEVRQDFSSLRLLSHLQEGDKATQRLWKVGAS